MKKKTLAIIIAVAMMCTAFCGMTATSWAAEGEDAYFTLYLTDADSPAGTEDVHAYKTFSKETYEAMAKEGAPLVAAYIKGDPGAADVYVNKSSKYVELKYLLEGYLLDGNNIDKLYATTSNKDTGAFEVYGKVDYKDYLDGGFYYGDTPAKAETFKGEGIAMPLAASVTAGKATLESGQKISDILKAELAEKEQILMICPSLNEKDSAGKRICQGMNGIAVDVNEEALIDNTSLSVNVAKKKSTIVVDQTYLKMLKAEGYKVTCKYYVQKKGAKKWTKLSSKTYKKGTAKKYYRYKAVITAKSGDKVFKASPISDYRKFK